VTGSAYVTQDSAGGAGANAAGDRFGSTLQAGRFDAGGQWDLVIGAYREGIARYSTPATSSFSQARRRRRPDTNPPERGP